MLGAIIGDMVDFVFQLHPIKTKDFDIYSNGTEMAD